MGRWIRVDVTRQQHPKAMQAGGWGMVVAQAIWEICKAHDKPGVVPPYYWQAEFLARWTNFDKERGGKTGIIKGMKQALDAGLLEEIEDGSIGIHDWKQYQVDPRIGNRKAESNNNGNLKADNTESSSVIQDDTSPVRCHPEKSIRQDRTGQDRTGQIDLVPDAPGSDPEPPRMHFDYKTEKWNRRPCESELKRWSAAYPAIDIDKEMAKATNWLVVKKKTNRKKDFEAFLMNWFNGEQKRMDARTY